MAFKNQIFSLRIMFSLIPVYAWFCRQFPYTPDFVVNSRIRLILSSLPLICIYSKHLYMGTMSLYIKRRWKYHVNQSVSTFLVKSSFIALGRYMADTVVPFDRFTIIVVLHSPGTSVNNLILFEYFDLIGLSAWRKFWLYSITWVGIVTSPTCSSGNDKFK